MLSDELIDIVHMVAQKERPGPAPTAAVALVEVAIMALGIRLRVDPMEEEDGVD